MARRRRRAKSLLGKPVHQVAHITFFVGLALAIIIGLLNGPVTAILGNEAGTIIVTTFVFLGTIVGLFNLTAKETMPFLTAAIALMLAGIVNLQLVYGIGDVLRPTLSNIVVFVVPGAIIVGLKTVWKLASD